MSKEKYTALILGANGLIGEELLRFLLNNDSYTKIYTVSRVDLPHNQDKIVKIIADSNNIESKITDLSIDHLFCCIGTTKNKVKSEVEYFKIDHDYPILVAKLLKKQGCDKIAIVSSIGANSKSKNFYLKMKGKIEEDVISLNFKSTLIFRPSLLIGKRKETRPLETLAKYIIPLINIFLIGRWKDYRSIKASIVASAIEKSVLKSKSGIYIYQTEEIKENA